MAEEHIVIPLDEFADNLSSIFHRVLRDRRVFWVEGEFGEFVEVKAAPGHRSARRKRTADVQSFIDAAGSWSDVDADAFVHAVYEQRAQSYRPSVEL